MTPQEFAPLVAKYGLPIPWLAHHVGGVQERTFRYWVNGRPGVSLIVPKDAVDRLRRLNAALDKALAVN